MNSPPGPESDQESSSHDEEEEEVTSRPRTSTELRNMQKDFTRQPGEPIITWLLRCWDNGADGHELEGTEAKQLGSLAREGGIDKAIAREKTSLSLWRWLLAAVKERFPYKDDVTSRSANWTTIDKGIQSVRESAIVEMIYHIKPNNGDTPIDPDEVECTRPMWRKLTRNAPSSYAHSLATVTWNDIVPLTVDEGHLTLNHDTQGSVQPGLEHHQGWSIHNFPGQPIPVPLHPKRK
ncbi:uncharacterized protein LOC133277177 [Pezoporus flaviventris]|uniref:uncharacterized protein LOC133277177 n=1 Tax=Pezoporus flaviventris TaxID=889875 RepID=UPI002AB174F5|nr:uncharacterized protein LOC133277177 [Pezoporus flaviventris]